MSMGERYVCENCREVTDAPLTAPNPFYPRETISGCPNCKVANRLVAACWKCDREASCGIPTKEHGYVVACHEHWPREDNG